MSDNKLTPQLTVDRQRRSLILFEGHDITRSLPHRRCRAPIGRSYQIALPFACLTVFENLAILWI